MDAQTSWTSTQPPRHATQEMPGCSFRTHDVPRLGRVVEVVLEGRRNAEFWLEMRSLLGREVPRRAPQYLVFDLRGLDCLVGSACLAGLVAGAVEMMRLGRPQGTRIVATGEMAGRLTKSLSLCKLEPVFGAVHASVAAAVVGIVRTALKAS